ncbi:hypothetical protein A4X20_19975 [Mycolicibacterium iranicum]|uniref:Uncharacterized protein n=1 Tax=Mycolicibacterium iranicum TaxID=912594 RepID=A0A178LV55_MYCIR|nr:hypothetical protein A4X20_19975 [Mycolicibacterium iranicum]
MRILTLSIEAFARLKTIAVNHAASMSDHEQSRAGQHLEHAAPPELRGETWPSVAVVCHLNVGESQDALSTTTGALCCTGAAAWMWPVCAA